LEEGRSRESISVAEEILEIDPRSLDGHVTLGLARLDENLLEEASASFSHAIEIQSDDHVALLHRGITHLRLGRIEAAVQDLNAALKNHPDCDETFYNLAIAYVGLGNRDAALDSLQTAIEIHPPRRAEAQTAAEFDSLRSEPRFRAVLSRKSRARKDTSSSSEV
jgi:tetratricopeptide (TPR) repeat protein